eukprot:TRINITY_DN17967_c0_g1_i1.p1 TRINITY_DN17967_c0_g1~~TRINITY_DN17967_c0_g1_i1.p1  ORF type:complete len:785 (+),score=165.94 TRINITY_DN17967_c0_g1_i1:149-2503(+)
MGRGSNGKGGKKGGNGSSGHGSRRGGPRGRTVRDRVIDAIFADDAVFAAAVASPDGGGFLALMSDEDGSADDTPAGSEGDSAGDMIADEPQPPAEVLLNRQEAAASSLDAPSTRLQQKEARRPEQQPRASVVLPASTVVWEMPEAAVCRIVAYGCSHVSDLLFMGAVDKTWRSAVGAPDNQSRRDSLIQAMFIPSYWQLCLSDACKRCVPAGWWPTFGARQEKLQRVFAGRYRGIVTEDNRNDMLAWAIDEHFNWEDELHVTLDLEPAWAAGDRAGHGTHRVCAESEMGASQEDDQLPELAMDWLVLDRRQALDARLWSELVGAFADDDGWNLEARGPAIKIDKQKLLQPDGPPEHWEDGDCYCGVRGKADFRPLVDPSFLDLQTLGILLIPKFDASNRRPAEREAYFWSPRLYSPSSWMFPKLSKDVEVLQHIADFRDPCTVSALTLGRRLERAVPYSTLRSLHGLVQQSGGATASGSIPSTPSGTPAFSPALQPCSPPPLDADGPAPSGNSRKARKAAKAERKAAANLTGPNPRHQCSGKNPRGLNYFVPRDKEAIASRPRARSSSNSWCWSRRSVLYCDANTTELNEFLGAHLPTMREVEKLWVGTRSREDAERMPPSGMYEDAEKMLEGDVSMSGIAMLAKKWNILEGKWLLFVPEWRIDELFSALARLLRDGMLKGCTDVVVSPPGAYGTDAEKFMLSARCLDFRDKQSCGAVGQKLSHCARQGLRGPPRGSWGEMQDDPFAAKEKKVQLVFKPDIFGHLGIHRNNPYGLKPSIYSLEL